MWFKNLIVYRFTKPFTLAAEQLAEQLAALPFRPCGSQEVSRVGFVPPTGEDGDYVHQASGYIMICIKKQQRVLPAAAITEAVEEKIKALEAKEGRKVGRKERQQIKEELTITMLPKAFTRSSRLYAYIAPQEGRLIVNSGSTNQAEELLVTLREALGSLPVIPASCNSTPQQIMTHWVKDQPAMTGFTLGYECELRDPGEDGGVIRCKNQNLAAANIINHLEEGMLVSKLAMVSETGIECIVDENLTIKRLKFGDMIQEKADAEDPENAEQQFDVDFTIMTLEITLFLNQLFAVFGGENLMAAGIGHADEYSD